MSTRVASAPRPRSEIEEAAGQPLLESGSGGPTGTGYYLPKLFEETLGLKFNIITGYQGGGPVDLAVERGEIHAIEPNLNVVPDYGYLAPNEGMLEPLAATRARPGTPT